MKLLALIYERYRFRRWADVGWTCLGLILGTACAYFPLYVQWNSEAFDPPELIYSKDRDPDDASLLTEYREPDLEPFDIWSLTRPVLVDDVTTGTVRPAVSNEPPVVFDSRVRSILSSHGGGFLILGPDGIDFVPRGGSIAGSGRIERVEQRDGSIAVITSSGERIIARRAGPQATDK